MLASHQFGLTDRRDEDIGGLSDGGEVAGTAVADRHRRVAPQSLLHEQQCLRLAHNLAAAQHHNMLTGRLDSFADQQLLYAIGGAGHEPRSPLDHEADVLGVKTVHILERGDRVEHRLGLDLFRHRKLDEDAMDARIGVPGGHAIEQLGLRGRRGQRRHRAAKAGLLAGDLFVLHVDGARWVVAHQRHDEVRGHAVSANQFGCSHGIFLTNRQCMGLAIDHPSRHDAPVSFCLAAVG